MVERFGVGIVERAALCDGPKAFLEWCDSLVERPDRALAAASRAAYAVTASEIHDRGPAFVRLRTGLLRIRLRGDGWAQCDILLASFHAYWLAVGERRAEAAAALASVPDSAAAIWPQATAVGAAARRALGRVRAEELLSLANATEEISLAAWLRSEAALDLCERRQGAEARALARRANEDAEKTGRWEEVWTRRRDATRVHLRLRDWEAAATELDAMKALEPKLVEGNWYARQRAVLATRVADNEATARPAGP